MSATLAPELVYSKKRQRDEEVPVILRRPAPRPPTIFRAEPTFRAIDPPTPFSLRRRAEVAKPTALAAYPPAANEPVRGAKSLDGTGDDDGLADPLDGNDEASAEAAAPVPAPDPAPTSPTSPEIDDTAPFAPPPDDDDGDARGTEAAAPFAPPDDDNNEDDARQSSADEFERLARDALDAPSFGALAAILEAGDASSLEAFLQIAPQRLRDAHRRCRAAANAPLASDAARLRAIDAWRGEAARRLAPDAYAAVMDAVEAGDAARALRAEPELARAFAAVSREGARTQGALRLRPRLGGAGSGRGRRAGVGPTL